MLRVYSAGLQCDIIKYEAHLGLMAHKHTCPEQSFGPQILWIFFVVSQAAGLAEREKTAPSHVPLAVKPVVESNWPSCF